MNRAQLTTYLVNKFGALAADTGTALTDTSDGFGPAIDQSLRVLGVDEEDLATAVVTGKLVIHWQALADYFLLDMFETKLIVRVDTALDERVVSRLESQAAKNLRPKVEAALKVCQRYGYLKQQLQSGWFSTGYMAAETITDENADV